MKKVFKISALVLGVLLALLIILPIAFKGKIVETVKTTINESVNARVDFGDFRISLLRNFPNLSLRIDDLSIAGVGAFEGDTLAAIGRVRLTFNLASLWSSTGYEIKAIQVDRPRIHVKVLKDGQANWDIMKESAEETVEVSESESSFQMALRLFEIKQGHLVYDDAEMDVYVKAENLNHRLRGDFTADFTTLSITRTSIERLFVAFEGMPLLAGVSANLVADIDADLEAFAFTFRDNELALNDFPVVFEGTFAMPDDAMVMDFVFSSPRSDFKALLSLIPGIYAKEFDGLKASGGLQFDGHVKGVFDEVSMPGFGFNLLVDNGMFQYPDLPAAVTDVHIQTRIFNPGPDVDLTEVDVNRFSLRMAGNPVEFGMKLLTPVSDPQIDAFLKGKLDLGKVKDFYPLEPGASLSGVIESNLEARGRMSSIENERYQDFHAAGLLAINALQYTSSDFPDGVKIHRAAMSFSPQYMSLEAFDAQMGVNDIQAQGRIDNILGFLLSEQLLTGTFETRSRLIDLNTLMSETAEAPVEEESVPLSVIEIPANIDFTLRGNFDKIIFGDLEITQTQGIIRIVDQAARMENLRMNMLGGTLVLNGAYDSKDPKMPAIDFGLNIREFDLQQTFQTFNTFRVLAPIGERTLGKFSASFDLRSILDQQLNPVLNSLAGGGSLSSNALTVKNSPALLGLADNLKMDMFKEINLRDVLVDFVFRDGKVEVKPFDLRLGNMTGTLGGNHFFDQTIDYVMKLNIPRSEFGGAANQALSGLTGQAAAKGISLSPGQNVNLDVLIGGTSTQPKISVGLSGMMDDLRDQLRDEADRLLRDATDRAKQEIQQVKDQVQDRVDDAKEKLSEELDKRAQEVVDAAQRQAETIRREAANAASVIRNEARAQAKKLEDEASGPIQVAAAKRTGDQLIKSADERARKLETDADANAKRLVDEANTRADKIRSGQE